MNDLIITICHDTRKVKLNRGFIGLNGENLQGNIIVDFTDKADFIDGVASFEIKQNSEKYFIAMEKDAENKLYKLPIKSSLLSYTGDMPCQVSISQAETENDAPVFKSEIFQVTCLEAVNATETIPDQYPTWGEIINAKIAEMEALIEDMEEKTTHIVQSTGQSTEAVMSQDAVTREITALWDKINYVEPSIAQFELTPSGRSYKLPATFTLKSIKHRETGIDNIDGYVCLQRNSVNIKTQIPPTETVVSVEVSDTVTLTTAGVKYSLWGITKDNEIIQKSITISGYYTSYIGASEDSTVSDTVIAGLTDTDSGSLAGTRTVTISGTSKYVWFISTKSISTLKSSGFDVPFTLVDGSYSYNGTTYKCYRTTEKVVVGENTFVIV